MLISFTVISYCIRACSFFFISCSQNSNHAFTVILEDAPILLCSSSYLASANHFFASETLSKCFSVLFLVLPTNLAAYLPSFLWTIPVPNSFKVFTHIYQLLYRIKESDTVYYITTFSLLFQLHISMFSTDD